jgi:hypothetical protein
VIQEMIACNRRFYSLPGVLRRVWSSLWQGRGPFINLVTNLSTRNNSHVEREAYADFQQQRSAVLASPRSVPPALVASFSQGESASGRA